MPEEVEKSRRRESKVKVESRGVEKSRSREVEAQEFDLSTGQLLDPWTGLREVAGEEFQLSTPRLLDFSTIC
jgi:hypothetical protein